MMRRPESASTKACYCAIWLADQTASRPPPTVGVVPWRQSAGSLARQTAAAAIASRAIATADRVIGPCGCGRRAWMQSGWHVGARGIARDGYSSDPYGALRRCSVWL